MRIASVLGDFFADEVCLGESEVSPGANFVLYLCTTSIPTNEQGLKSCAMVDGKTSILLVGVSNQRVKL